MGSLHGFEIDCDRELRRLGPVPGGHGTVRIRASSETLLDRNCELLRLIPDAEGAPRFALGRGDGRLLSWHADGGSFLIDGAAGSIAYRAEDAWVGSAATRWEHRLGSSALLLAGERDALPLHASAVAMDGRAIVICGVTGRGKSTLAATLVARGHEAIAEDGVAVRFDRGRPVVWPGLTGALITSEVADTVGIADTADRADARGRIFVEAPRVVPGPSPVAAVAILMERAGDRVELVRPGTAKAHRELLAHIVCADKRGPAAFAAAARLVERVPTALLVVPDSIGELGAAAEALEALGAAPVG